MTILDIAHQRLYNQHIAKAQFENPEYVVQWLGAVQAQDYAAAKWAVAQRTTESTDADLDRVFAAGTILRTHVLRPTWHFVAPTDIRWMLALTAPRINASLAYFYRQLDLDDVVFARSNAALAKALQDGKQLTRQELLSVLQLAGLATDNLLRFNHLMIRAELDAVVCSGALRGKQHTYALLDERVPQTRALTREEALAELAWRYFTSHGTATLQDFVWWSGLTVADARAGLEMVASQLMHEVVEDQTYWFSTSTPPAYDLSQSIYLLPNFDEYTVGYTDRSAVFDVSDLTKFDARGNVLNPTIVLDGRVVGTWKRTIKKDTVIVTPSLFAPLNEAEMRSFIESANRYGQFLGMPVNVTFQVE